MDVDYLPLCISLSICEMGTMSLTPWSHMERKNKAKHVGVTDTQ